MKLRINPVVVEDLEVIRDFIADDNQEMASKTIAEIYKRFENLELFPSMGTDLSKLVNFPTDYKFIMYGNYIIIYKVEGDFVSIYRVINRNQNFQSIIFRDDIASYGRVDDK